ncbi:MAG: phosphatase PAP2 family protein [Chlamydiae bacterium]|nr:phosphatase PAP2 family protein [Chlamydiota bacterium]
MEPFFDQQVLFLETLSSHRSALGNLFFISLSYLDNFWVYLGFVLAGWLRMGKLRGLHLFVLFFLNYVAIFSLKVFFEVARPPESLWLIHPHTWGFPSGASSHTTLILGYFISQSERFLTRFFFAFIIFIVVFSRLYLGVHFPLDVLCGFAIGIIFLVIYFESIESILTISRKIPPFADFLVGGVLICLFYFNLPRTYEIQELYFLTVGVLFGTCLRNYYPFPFAEKGITAVIVVFLIGVIFLSYFLLPPIKYPIIYPLMAFIGLIPSLIAPAIANFLLYPKNTIHDDQE